MTQTGTPAPHRSPRNLFEGSRQTRMAAQVARGTKAACRSCDAVRPRCLVETSQDRTQAGFSVPANATPVDVSLMLREKGWTAYRIRADHLAFMWIARVIDWQRAA